MICLPLNQLTGLRSSVVRIHLHEESSIKNDPAVDRYLDGLSLLHVKCRTLAVTMVSSEQGDEFLAAFNEMGFHPLLVRMVLKRKCFQCVNALSPTEFRDGKIDQCFPKCLAVIIQIPTLQFVVLQPIVCLFLLTVIVYDALWLISTKASRVDHRVWLEKCPKQIESDFLIRQKQEKALSRRFIGCFDEVNQKVQVPKAGRIMDGTGVCITPIRFQFMEVVVAQILFNLGSS